MAARGAARHCSARHWLAQLRAWPNSGVTTTRLPDQKDTLVAGYGCGATALWRACDSAQTPGWLAEGIRWQNSGFRPSIHTTPVSFGSKTSCAFRLTPPGSSNMVLYVFEVRGTAFLKVGFTAGCPWARVRDGLWRVVHPKACCNLLGWDNLELLSLFSGDLADEARLQARISPECGEFWPQDRLDELRRALTDLSSALGADSSSSCGSACKPISARAARPWRCPRWIAPPAAPR